MEGSPRNRHVPTRILHAVKYFGAIEDVAEAPSWPIKVANKVLCNQGGVKAWNLIERLMQQQVCYENIAISLQASCLHYGYKLPYSSTSSIPSLMEPTANFSRATPRQAYFGYVEATLYVRLKRLALDLLPP